MQLLGLILLAASSWYLWQLTSNFLDEPTKKELSNSFNNLKNKLQERKQSFSKELKFTFKTLTSEKRFFLVAIWLILLQ